MSNPEFIRRYETFSGFTLAITPLPPYHMDIVSDLYPYREYPKRKFKNIAGDEFELKYEPPDEPVLEGDEDYLLYMEYLATVAHNEEMDDMRHKRREDFLLAMCVTVEDGPIDIESTDWRQRVEAAFQDVNFQLPTHPGSLMLLFLKTVVITRPMEKLNIIQLAVYEEVDMQGIFRALQSFPSDVGE